MQTDPDPRTVPYLELRQIDVTLQPAEILKKMTKATANILLTCQSSVLGWNWHHQEGSTDAIFKQTVLI